MQQIPPTLFHKVLPLLKTAEIDTTFAKGVIIGMAPGIIFVNDVEFPSVCYIAIGYGMSLLCGSLKTFPTEYQEKLKKWIFDVIFGRTISRTKYEWLQISPVVEWKGLLEMEAGNPEPNKVGGPFDEKKFIINSRMNFKFCRKQLDLKIPEHHSIVPVSEEIFNTFQGLVRPSSFGKNFQTWTRLGGVGFCVKFEEKIISVAFGAVVFEDKLEIAIETAPEFRGKGYAKLVCSAILNYCSERNLIPVWSCLGTNIGSIKLAESIGFKIVEFPFGPIPYYHLPYDSSRSLPDYRQLLLIE